MGLPGRSQRLWSAGYQHCVVELGCGGQCLGGKQVSECFFRLSGGGCVHEKVTDFTCHLAHLALEEAP